MKRTRNSVWPLAGKITCIVVGMLCAAMLWDRAPSTSGLFQRPLALAVWHGSRTDAAIQTASQRRGIRPTAGATETGRGQPAGEHRAKSEGSRSGVALPDRERGAERPPREPSLSLPGLESGSWPEISLDAFSDWVSTKVSKSKVVQVPRVHDPGLNAMPPREGRRPAIASSWPYPHPLIELLTPLGTTPTLGGWQGQVREQLLELHAVDSLGDSRAGDVLNRLQHLMEEGLERINQLEDGAERVSAARATRALQRRLLIWQQVHQLSRVPVTEVSLGDRDVPALAGTLQAVNGHLDRLSQPEAWRDYLLLDQLSDIALRRAPISFQERVTLARTFLQRLEAADSTPEQESFFAHPDWRKLAHEVRRWICEPVDYEALLDDVERLENVGGERAAQELADHYQLLRWSSNPLLQELGNRIDAHYRGANVRVAVSGRLLNRLLPPRIIFDEGVNDRLLGGRVLGRSQISTRLRLVLLPDRKRWRMGLEAHGNVDSKTHTKRGPARFHNAGRGRYLARKLLLIDQQGLHTRDALADASSDTDLTRVETQLDGVPLVNLLARTVAKQMYTLRENDARHQAEGLLVRQAESRLDQEVNQTLGTATTKFREQIWQPLQELGLSPRVVNMRTTSEHLSAGYRLAGVKQIGAFTSPPHTPADSLLSIQVHESMLNNTVSSLNLGGRQVGLRDLFADVAGKLQRDDYQIPDDVPGNVKIELAPENPVAFQFKNNRIHVILRIRKLLGSEGHSWNRFEVRGIYVPDVEGIRIGVQRESYVRLKGDRHHLSMRDQVALRGIFARVLPEHPDIDLLANILAKDQRLHDLRLNQLVIRNGWFAIALGSGTPVKMNVADDPRGKRNR
ncbi:MAG: hypothetical protein ACODAD_08520 [Planctomycetota bacterium]